ncbi:Cof-type HAD-IIB family hydrolase [Maribacter antarcticus]|uniref:Cof-type HAD-IIB family hydrolase n=1 Tax=Maribacter antarcticus TaxID=505250 RepID=UPI00047EBCA3|nr:Cof-type HAD-IIB family hydrolase [Maribacter antarcticus]
MNYQVLCSDLDGTLLSTKDDVSDFTIREIKRIRNIIRIILVSARMPSGMYYLQKRLGIDQQPIICYNGALVLQGDKTLLSVTIPSTILSQVHVMTSPLGIDLGVYAHDNWFVPKTSERVEKEIKHTKTQPTFQQTKSTLTKLKHEGAHKVMLMCSKESANQITPLLKSNFSNELNIYRSNDTLIEIAPKSVSKRSAIAHILKQTESFKDIIAFGDNYNDIEMIEAAGCGVAVANARTELKKVANHITLANTDNGVADFIRRHLDI